MGYDLDSVVVGADVAHDHFICSVCTDLVEDPVTLDRVRKFFEISI